MKGGSWQKCAQMVVQYFLKLSFLEIRADWSLVGDGGLHKPFVSGRLFPEKAHNCGLVKHLDIPDTKPTNG